MANVIPNLGALSAGLTGLSEGLSGLAQRKLSALHQQEERGRLAQLFSKVKTPSGEPISPEYAELIPNLPQNQWLSAIQSLKGSAQEQQPAGQQQAAYQPGQIAQKLQQFSQASKEQEPNLSPLQLMKFLQAPEAQKQTEAQALSALNPNDIFERAALKDIAISPEEKQQIMKDIETINSNQALRKEIEPLIQKLQQQQQAQQPQEQAAVKPTGQYFEKPLTEKEKLALKKDLREERKEARQEKEFALNLTKKEREEINNKYKAAKSSLEDLDRLEELEKEGKLDTPGYIEFLKRSGFDIPSLLSEGSQEYNKIVNNFVRDAKSVYGSRITNNELEQYLKTLPSLSQSPEGRKRVLANLKRIKRGDLEYGKALKEVLAENRGIPPYDLSEQVDEKVGKKLDALSKKFKEEIAKPVPPGQERYKTAIQAALGSIIGSPGALIGKVGHIAAAL